MKRILLIGIMVFCASMAFAGYHSSPPLEGARMRAVATGSENLTFWMSPNTDGTWQVVSLPAGTECKAVLIQVVDGTDTIYDPDSGNSPFLFSSKSNGTGWVRAPATGIIQSLGKIQSESGTLGYVKAATGQKIAVMILY